MDKDAGKNSRGYGGCKRKSDDLIGECFFRAARFCEYQLRRAGYNDWVTAEIFPQAGRDHKEFLIKNSKAMDKIINEM